MLQINISVVHIYLVSAVKKVALYKDE